LKIAIHQMCSGIDAQNNAREIAKNISDAAAQGAVMYFAPEMSGLIDRDRGRAAASIGIESESLALTAAQRACKEAKIWAHLGSLPIKDGATDALIRNRSFIIDDEGVIRARYDKIHLFDVDLSNGESWRESNAYAAGTDSAIVDTPIGVMGLSICYDLRFPKLYNGLRDSGATIFAVPAAFTVPTGDAHWHILLRARAIENACFVVAAAQFGQHADGRQTYGHSLVIDPWGKVVLDMDCDTALGFAELDLSQVATARAQVPVHLNQRPIPDPIHYSAAKHVRATQ
jgi:deaminated glutathione amidase